MDFIVLVIELLHETPALIPLYVLLVLCSIFVLYEVISKK